MKKRRYLGLIVCLMMAFVLLLGMSACGSQEDEAADGAGEEAAMVGPELTQEQWDGILWEIGDKELTKDYAEYVPDEGFANAEIFGIDKDGDKGTAYVWLDTREYVVVKDSAYMMSGGAGEAIIKFTYGAEKPALDEVVWSADGGEHDKWLEENFPADYLAKQKEYNAYNEDGTSAMNDLFAQQVEAEMGVPVAADDLLLEINVDNGTYTIDKVSESGEGENYKFDTEEVEKGKLSDLQ